MSEASTPGGRFSIVQGGAAQLPAVSPELQAILLPIEDKALQEKITRAYYTLMEGDPSSISVQFAILLSALVHAKTAQGQLTSGNGQAPDLKLEQLSKLNKSMAEFLAGHGSIDRLLKDHFEKLPERIIQAAEKKVAASSVGSRWPAWVQKSWSVMSNRWFIALACLLLGMLPGSLLVVYMSHEAGQKRLEELTATVNRLPDILRLQLSGNITYSPAAAGKPAKVVLNFGEKLRPATAEVTRSNEVSVIFAP